MPDNFFHKHEMTEMGMAAWHKPGQKIKRRTVPDGTGNREIVALADHNAPAHEIGYLGQFGKYRSYRIDTKFGKCLLYIKRGGA